jgi:hypothetical protein
VVAWVTVAAVIAAVGMITLIAAALVAAFGER